jgi:GNAT superfamily N-acetyltransferase
MDFTPLSSDDLQPTLNILRQDALRYSDGRYPEAAWVGNFFVESGCHVYGLKENNELKAVLIGEAISSGGFLMWFLAVKPELQGLGLGSHLLNEFEAILPTLGMHWIFLNATGNSLDFYHKHGYITGKHAQVWEHYKDV